MRTDFELFGVATDDVAVRDRSWVFTIDFEAFDPTRIELWIDAMRVWAYVSRRLRWHSSVFLSLENVLQLKAARPEQYRPFLDAAHRMAMSGATFYPHNHGIFDDRTGRHPRRPDRIDGYRKRPCMFFDVVYRHGRAIDEWLVYLRSLYEQILGDAGIPQPAQLAFRAGGWDYGDTEDDVKAFVAALKAAEFAWDSSASVGVFGTRTWRAGAPYGRNVFGLGPEVIEAAACWSVDKMNRLHEPRTAHALFNLGTQPDLWRQRAGIFVTVFHFNTLFDSRADAPSRINKLFAKLSLLRKMLRMTTVPFGDIAVTRS